jgi:hypothetical protein
MTDATPGRDSVEEVPGDDREAESETSASDLHIVKVALPTDDSQGTCYHAPRSGCADKTETVRIAADDLRRDDVLSACQSCVKHRGLKDYSEDVYGGEKA